MDFEALEGLLGVALPPAHRRAMLELGDRIHGACDFLCIESPHRLLRIVEVNRRLQDADGNADPWPAFLIAIASQGCGDYFAYDTRERPPIIRYIDPDRTVHENLNAADAIVYASFDTWRAAQVRA